MRVNLMAYLSVKMKGKTMSDQRPIACSHTHLGQGYFPGDAALLAEQAHSACERRKTPRESRVNA